MRDYKEFGALCNRARCVGHERGGEIGGGGRIRSKGEIAKTLSCNLSFGLGWVI